MKSKTRFQVPPFDLAVDSASANYANVVVYALQKIQLPLISPTYTSENRGGPTRPAGVK
jgi:hypothetical protein